jgi:uncharacterized membrane protein
MTMTTHLQRPLLAILMLTLLASCASAAAVNAPAIANTPVIASKPIAVSSPAVVNTPVVASKPAVVNTPTAKPQAAEQASAFAGEKGSFVALDSGQLKLDAKVFTDSTAHYYSTRLANGKTVYFFVVKDGAGVYRAAANACQVCYASHLGFHQEGDQMVCNTCGNRYPVNKIATEKGGCNPVPINPNIQSKDGQLLIKEADLAALAKYF